jgi:hypothetical protein
MTTYLVSITGDLGAALPSVGEVIREVNENMKSFGVSERMVVRGQLCEVKMTTSRPLTDEEKTAIHRDMTTEFRDKLPHVDIEVAPPDEWVQFDGDS